MTPGDLIIKDPQSDEPYYMNWTAWLADLGPTVVIASSEWLVSGSEGSPVPLTIHDALVLAGDRTTQAFFSGGTNGKKYRVTNRIVTNSVPDATDDRSVWMLVNPK